MWHDQKSENDLKLVANKNTLPFVLDNACYQHPNSQALQHWQSGKWQSMSNQAFQAASEAWAFGLLALGLQQGDRVALLMQSDTDFCIADMACLLAGLVDVPIDLGFHAAAIEQILRQTEAKLIFCANRKLLRQLASVVSSLPNLQTIVLISELIVEDANQPNFLSLENIKLLSVSELVSKGELKQVELDRHQLYAIADPDDLATIVYTASPSGQPRGVMLSHASLVGDILTAFTAFTTLQQGGSEVALMFLPMTHVFARAFFYGHLAYGHSVYFSSPSRVSKHLQTVQPTILITVPRLLEKTYENILETRQLNQIQRQVVNWAVRLARRYDVAQLPHGLYAWQLRLADRLVFSRWRAGFGGRVKYLICGGAKLGAELTNVFAAAKIPVYQGYGLTETSSVLCCNRESFNQAGTVGKPIAGIEIQLAADGEILAKTSYAMQGYYQDPIATQQTVDAAGWLHTGDLGEWTAAGALKITGYKKNLFKLSTGKYVAPQPIEAALKASPLVKQAIVVGAERKFCGLLIFPDLDYLCPRAEGMCLELAIDRLLQHPKITAQYQVLIDTVNQTLPHWSTVKRFRLLHLTLTLPAGQEFPALSLSRDRINQLFASEIEQLYRDHGSSETASSADTNVVVRGMQLLSLSPYRRLLNALHHTHIRSGGSANHG